MSACSELDAHQEKLTNDIRSLANDERRINQE